MRLPGEAVAGLGALLADHDVALIKQNVILAHQATILADPGAILANQNALLADRDARRPSSDACWRGGAGWPPPKSTLPERTVTRNHHFGLPQGSGGKRKIEFLTLI